MIAAVLRAILFDFNGVLIDDEPVHCALAQRVLAEEGLDLEEQEYYRAYVGLDDRGLFERVFAAARRELGSGMLPRLVARKAAYYQEWMRCHPYPFFPGVVELMRSAAASQLLLGIVSGALRSEIEPALRQAGIEELIKLVVSAEDVERGKPDPSGYLKALQELNRRPPLPERLVHPHEVLAVEDTASGLQAARAAGLLTLGLVHRGSVADLEGADLVAERLANVELLWLQQRLEEVSRR